MQAHGQPAQPDPQSLLGTWHLLRWEIAYSDGRPSSLPFGPDATGLIVYTPEGTMSACIARAARPALSGQSTRSAPAAERLAAFESYFQYAGRFHTRWHDGRAQVVHQVSHSLNPNFVGTDQVRNMDFAEDGRLTLSASEPLPPPPTSAGAATAVATVLRHHLLVWQRGAS